MDIILQTNDPSKYLALLGVERFSDRSGVCCVLIVKSDSFAGQTQLCVEAELFDNFVSNVERMDATLTGKARLQPLREETYLELEANRAGRLAISGLLVSGDDSHRLSFQFGADQTCLAPLGRDLRLCQSRVAT